MSGVATPADGITTDVASTTDTETTPVPEVTVDVVVAALAPTAETTDDTDEPGWSVPDPIFWETVTAKGAPLLRHPVDMVLHRGPHKRTITVFDAVIDDGHGRHR